MAILQYCIVQADRGFAMVAFFFGGEGGLSSKKGVTLRVGATDFREERNPPQADSIVSINRESKLQYYNITILP
jgi:hypothetical protein